MACGCGGSSKKQTAGGRAAARREARARGSAGKNAPAQPGYYWNGPRTRDKGTE